MSSHEMTVSKLRTIFSAAQDMESRRIVWENPIELKGVSKNLFSDFVTAARIQLREIDEISDEIIWLSEARPENAQKDSGVFLSRNECKATIICSAALWGRLTK